MIFHDNLITPVLEYAISKGMSNGLRGDQMLEFGLTIDLLYYKAMVENSETFGKEVNQILSATNLETEDNKTKRQDQLVRHLCTNMSENFKLSEKEMEMLTLLRLVSNNPQ